MDEPSSSPVPPKRLRSRWTRLLDKAAYIFARGLLKTVFKARAKGLENLQDLDGKPVIMIANHTSFLDPVLLTALLPTPPAFAIDTHIYNDLMKKPLARFFLSRVETFPLDTGNARAVMDLIHLAESGKSVMIFPEGRLTDTGSIMQTMKGAGLVADRAKASIVPIYIDGMNFLPGGLNRLPQYPKKLFPKLTMTVLPPQKLHLSPELKKNDRDQQRLDQVDKIMHEMPVQALDKNLSLMGGLHQAAKNFGYGRQIVQDMGHNKATYGDLLAGAYALGGQIEGFTHKGENVGMMLPNSNAAMTAFFGLQAFGRVATMMNPANKVLDIVNDIETASIRTILTSRAFVQQAGMEQKMNSLHEFCNVVYLEDLKPKISTAGKVKAWLQSRNLWPKPKDAGVGADPAVVLFTSGTESVPKGVVLSSTNLLSNIAQMQSMTPFMPTDKIFNGMPVYHSFGLGGGMLMPVMRGMASYQYANPRDAAKIPGQVYDSGCTILFGSNQLLNIWAHKATNDDFKQLRLVFQGSESLSEETSNTYLTRFQKIVYQGYGMTEASPTIAVNVPGATMQGSVGKFLPGIETRYEDTEYGRQLFIRGPNVMLGYLRHGKPGVIHAPIDGWHETGDIIAVDKGFAKIEGRASRFGKINGEKVSFDKIEKLAGAASTRKGTLHAVVLLRPKNEAERIVLFTTDPDFKRSEMVRAAAGDVLGIPENRDIHILDAMPLMPTGKINYRELKRMLDEAPAAAQTAAVSGPTTNSFNNANTPAKPAPPPVIGGNKFTGSSNDFTG